MPYCSQCGVEVDEIVRSCPLCQTPIQRMDDKGLPMHPYPDKAAGSPPLPPLTLGEKMGIARSITTMGILIPLLFVTAIDYFMNKRITWSAIVDVSLGGIWIMAVICLFSWKKPYLLSLFIHLDVILYLFILSWILGGSHWMIKAGIPITLGSNLIVWATLFIIRRIRRRGTIVAGVILLALALLCGAIDLTLGIQMGGIIKLGWSLIVFSVMIPTAALLFYLQSARFSHSTFRRFFHF